MSKINFVIVIVISLMYASLGGAVWFAGYGLLMDKFGGNNEDIVRMVLYTFIIFVIVFLIVFNRSKDDEYFE